LVDKQCVAQLKQNESNDEVKEDFKQFCVIGMPGIGKSAFMCEALNRLQLYCKNARLVTILQKDRYPLRLHISFNSLTPFDIWSEKNIVKAVCRRILSSYLRLSWVNEGRRIPIGNNISIADCIDAVAAHHRKVHHLDPNSNLFVFLGVDEIDRLIIDFKTAIDINTTSDEISSPGNSQLSDTEKLFYLKCLSLSLQSLNSNGATNCFVSTLMAGTRMSEATKSFLGSGIKPVNIPLPSLLKDDINSILVDDAGVCSEYMKSKYFGELVDGCGPALRAIGEIVHKLSFEYNVDAIRAAEAVAKGYFNTKQGYLTPSEAEYMCKLVTTGLIVTKLDDPLVPGSKLSLNTMQSNGAISCVPVDDGYFKIEVPPMILNSWIDYLSSPVLVHEIKELLALTHSCSWDSFEKFVASFHWYKSWVLSSGFPRQRVDKIFRLSDFYYGALISDDIRGQEFLLPDTQCPRPVWKLGTRFPSKKSGSATVSHLQSGGVLVNSKGAAIDLVLQEKVRDIGTVEWNYGIRAICVSHTVDDGIQLTPEKISEDYQKSMSSLASGSKVYRSMLPTVVHVSNRSLSPVVARAIKGDLQRTVIVSRENLDTVFGTLFGKRIRDSNNYIRSPRKNFSTASIICPVETVSKIMQAFVKRVVK